MDKNVRANGFKPEGLAPIAPTMQGVVDAGDLVGHGHAGLARKGAEVQLNPLIGKRDIAPNDLPMERDTLFRIAPMTKPITSVAALMLMEEGKIALGDPIHEMAA